jgi:tetratricopeptide (TPR) repeat protein
MKWLIILGCCFVAPMAARAKDGSVNQNKASQSQAILVEFHDSSEAPGERQVRVKEVESGKTTQLTLQKDAGRTQIWNGYFAIQFAAGDTNTRTLDFVSATGEPFYASVTQGKSAQRVVLFKTSEELASYEETIAPAGPSAPTATEGASTQTPSDQTTKKIQVVQHTPESAIVANGAAPGTASGVGPGAAKSRIELIEQQQKLTDAQKQQREERAAELAKKADEAYAKRNYKQALDGYTQAALLTPNDESLFYRRGVTLYKTGNYAKSLSALSGLEVDPSLTTEKDYYVALNHLKLKDYDRALKELIEVREEDSEELGPTASFFAGNIEFQKQKYPAARKSMEYVLDHSKDPKLDRSAEEMIEQIGRIEAAQASKSEKYRLTVFGGLAYDSNVLNIAENNVSTDVKAWRLVYGASAVAFLSRTVDTDLSVQLSLSDYYSLDSSFRGNSTLQAADALELGISLPYHRDLTLSKRTVGLEVTPSYKNIYMSPTGGTRSVVIRSTALATTVSTPLQSDLLGSARLDLGRDESLLDTSVGDNDLSGTRYGLTLIPLKLLDPKGQRIISGEISYLIDNTAGKEYRYERYGLAASYAFPTFRNGLGSLRVDYGVQNYRDATVPRKDTVGMLTAGYSKDLSRQWSWATTLQFTNANSDVDVYKYNKYLLMSLFTYNVSYGKSEAAVAPAAP